MSRRLSISLLAAVGLGTLPARAQNDADLQELLGATVVTTASQSAETSDVAPAISSTITADQLRRHGIHTLEEAVNFLSLGMSSGGRNFHGRPAEIGSRGVLVTGDDGNHVLLLINGHHVNDVGDGRARFDRLAGIPLEIVDYIEVIVGPGSVLYGSNAMLGVINVITKRAADYHGTHLVLEAGLIESLRTGAGAGYEFSLFGERAELTAAIEYFERRGPSFDVGPQNLGLDSFSGEPVRTGPDPEDATGIWGGSVDGGNYARVPSGLVRMTFGDFTLNVHGRHARVGQPFRTNFDDPDNYLEEQSLWLDLSYTKLLSPIVELTARVYGDASGQRTQIEDYADVGCNTRPPCTQRRTRLARWAGFELRTSFDWLKNKRVVTMIGVDERVRDVRAKSDLFDLGESVPLVSSTDVFEDQDGTVGAYLQQTLRPTLWLALNAGARIDYDRRFDPVVSPRVAAVTELWDGATLRGVYAEAFRAPTPLETRRDETSTVAPDLDPETVQSVEASIEQNIATHRLLVGVFRTEWSDMIGHRLLTPEERANFFGSINDFLGRDIVLGELENLSTIENYGLNAGYRATALNERLSFGLNVTWAEAREKGEDGRTRALPVAPRLFGNARVSYSFGEPLPTFGLAASYLRQRPADQAFEGDFTPFPMAPAQLELRAAITGPLPGVAGLSYRLIGNYATAAEGAYVIGPTQQSTLTQPSAELNPIDQYEAFVGLQYDFAK